MGTLATDQNLNHTVEFIGGIFSVHGNVAVGCTDYRFNTRRLESVVKIVLYELICGRNYDCANLVKCKYGEPELIVALEHEHNSVALFNAD